MEWAGDNISVMADFDTRFDEPCSEDHLADIFMLITDWRAVAPKLGLTEAEEIAILESTHSVPARKMAMLRRWKQKLGAKATYKRLVEAFKKCGLTDLEEKVVQMVTGSSTLKSAEVLPSPPSADHTESSAVVHSQAPTMADLMSHVAGKTPTKWYEVGIQLNIEISTLDAFEEQTSNQMRLYSKVFNQWKKNTNLPFTWDTIMNALERVGENETVTDIREWLRGETTSSDPSLAATASTSTAQAAAVPVPVPVPTKSFGSSTTSSRQSETKSQLGTKPSILKLSTMKGADGKPLNIIKEISATDYMTFGMHLLRDENRTTVHLLKKDHIQDGATSVTHAILQKWLASTVAPRTYQHLIDCLNLIEGLDGLAELIEEAPIDMY